MIFMLLALVVVPLCHAQPDYTLSDVVKFAHAYSESVVPNNKDLFNPVYIDYFATQHLTLAKKLLRFFGIERDPFPINYFITVFKEVIQEQASKGRSDNVTIIGTQLHMNEKFIIFGNIQGAFHSLVRNLQELKRQGLIDEQLKIVDPNCYIIFNGPTVARSAEPLQTLFVVLLLMQRNPDKVIYMESDFELQNEWRYKGFAQQVDTVYGAYKKEIFELFIKFIDVMPYALYGNYADQPEKLLKVTALNDYLYDTIEDHTGNFFFDLKKNDLSIHVMKKYEKTPKPVHARVLIQGVSPTLQTERLEPLMFLDPIEMASVWQVFSAPTFAFQKLFNFNQDAFAIITFGKELNSSIIQVYAANINTPGKFEMTGSYALDTGVPRKLTRANLTATHEKIYIGSSSDLTKSNLIMGGDVRTGVSLCLNALNEAGGIDKKEVQAFFFDDAYTPRLALANIKKFRDELGISTVLLPIGTPTILAAKDLIMSGDIFVAFPITGAADLRKPEVKGVINYRTSFAYETEHLVEFLINDYKLKTFGFFYQDDEYGNGALETAKEVLKKHGITKFLAIPYERNATNFSKQFEILKSEPVEALGCFSTAAGTKEFFRQVGAEALGTIKVFCLAFVVDSVFEEFVNHDLGLKCIFGRQVPDPHRSKLELVAEYRNLMDAVKKPYDVYSLEGFICTRLLCEMMQRVKGPITHTALLSEFENLKDFDLKGMTFTFTPEDRQVSKRLWIDLQDGSDWIEVKS